MTEQNIEEPEYQPEHAAPSKDPIAVSNSVYDKMKSFVQLVGPAIVTFYLFAGHAYELPNVEVNAGVGTAALTMLGVVVTWLSANFRKSDARFDGEIHITEDEDCVKRAALVLKNYVDPSDVVNQSEVTFKVNPPK